MITKTQKYLFNKLPKKLYKHIVIDLESGCWLWQVNINRNGYGRNYEKGKRHMAHITIYKLLKGNYKTGLVLDHLCEVKNCCNPSHLSPVTNAVNTNRGTGGLFKKSKPFKLPKDLYPDWFSDLLDGIDEPFIMDL